MPNCRWWFGFMLQTAGSSPQSSDHHGGPVQVELMPISRVIESSTVEAVLALKVTCEHCQRSPEPTLETPGDVFLEMRPGHDGTPWYLCAVCWFDGLFPNNPRGIPATARVLEPNGYPTP